MTSCGAIMYRMANGVHMGLHSVTTTDVCRLDDTSAAPAAGRGLDTRPSFGLTPTTTGALTPTFDAPRCENVASAR